MTGMRWAAVPLILLCAVAGCGGDHESTSRPEPHLGAPRVLPSHVPRTGMDDLEQPVAEMLGPRLEDDGLSLDYVECPPWSGSVPAVLRCKGYVDGVVGEVVVELSHRAGGRVDVDARLGRGVLAMARLVDRLRRQGYHGVDCGAASAYPAKVGMHIVCRVQRGGKVDHVVATVVDPHGAVRIEEY